MNDIPILKNIKHEMMVQLKLQGYSQRQAYKEVYDNNMTDKQIDEEASKIFNSPKVLQRYEELVKELEDKSIMSAKERMQWLTKVVNGEVTHTSYDSNGNAYDNEAYISDKIKAVDTLNKMDNAYQQNINIKGTIVNPYSNLTEEELRKLAQDESSS